VIAFLRQQKGRLQQTVPCVPQRVFSGLQYRTKDTDTVPFVYSIEHSNWYLCCKYLQTSEISSSLKARWTRMSSTNSFGFWCFCSWYQRHSSIWGEFYTCCRSLRFGGSILPHSYTTRYLYLQGWLQKAIIYLVVQLFKLTCIKLVGWFEINVSGSGPALCLALWGLKKPHEHKRRAQ
jgi:hypothetical protein